MNEIQTLNERFETNLDELQGFYRSVPDDNRHERKIIYEIKKEDRGCGLLLYLYRDGVFADQYLFVKNNTLHYGEDPDICLKPAPPHQDNRYPSVQGVYSSGNAYYDPLNKELVLIDGIYKKE